MTPPGARGGLLSAWQWVPCRHGGHAFTLSPLCPPGAEPPCLAGGWGVPPRTLPRRLCCGEGHGKGILHQPHSTGAASLQILENGTPAARGCRREAVLDAEKKPGTPVWQGHCLGPLPPCRGIGPLPQAPRGARQAHRAFQEPASGSERLHERSPVQWGEPLSTENIKLRQLFPKPAGFINTRFYI